MRASGYLGSPLPQALMPKQEGGAYFNIFVVLLDSFALKKNIEYIGPSLDLTW